MDSNLKDEDLVDFIEFMESTAFSKRFLSVVRVLSQELRIKAISEHGASPSLNGDIASIDERIAWLKPYAKRLLKDREDKKVSSLQNQRLGRSKRP